MLIFFSNHLQLNVHLGVSMEFAMHLIAAHATTDGQVQHAVKVYFEACMMMNPFPVHVFWKPQH